MSATNQIKKIKRDILWAAHTAKEGHIASAFSVLDILYVLYDGILRHDSRNPSWPGRDFVILSKGHASLALYAVLAYQEYFPEGWLLDMCSVNSPLGGHPDHCKVPGVEASTGSLGHGLPMAVGMAMALKYGKAENRVFCIVGDGELNEGSNWEALMLANQHRLSNLTLVVDYNRSNDRAVSLEPLVDKLKAFGWETITGIDGHDHDSLRSRFHYACHADLPGPCALIADTIKGFGLSAMVKEPHAWHHRTPTAEEFENFNRELA